MSASHEPPGIPEVHDEAGDSPRWLPWLGVAVFCLLAALVVTRTSPEPQAEGAATEEPSGNGTEEGVEPAPAQEAKPADKPDPGH